MTATDESLERAWQEMRFITRSMPGPRALPYVQELAEIEREMAKVVPLNQEAQEVLHEYAMERIRHVVDACRREGSSLG